MKNTAFFLASLFLLLLSTARPARAQRADLLVDDDKVQCPNAGYTSIQDAVNHAQPGDIIRVCPGIYHEQVVIHENLQIHGDNGAVVQPNGVTQNATGAASGVALAAIILVHDASSVKIDGLILDGSNNMLAACAPDLIGILYQNASGTIEHNAIRHMRLAPALSGCQSGEAILVQSSGGLMSQVHIAENSVQDYQKNGITGNESSTGVNIDRNVVTGIGPTAGAAQNGIQIGYGAQGAIRNNIVADNVYSPCSSLASCPTNATGILVFESNSVIVDGNSAGSNQIGIFAQGDSTRIANNNVFNSIVIDGIYVSGNNTQVLQNAVTHSDLDAIFIQGNNNSIDGNVIIDATVGIFKVAGFSGNTLSGNSIFATLVPVLDPAPVRAITPVPMR